MRIYTESAIMRAAKYSDIFSSDGAEAKRQFRHYCKSYHPDVDSSAHASEVFEKLMALYGKTPSPKEGTNPGGQPVVFRSKASHKGFEMDGPVTFSAGTCTVFHTRTKVALSYGKEFKKFYGRYIDAVGRIQYADSKMEAQFSRLFPKVASHFEDEDGNFVILLDKTPEVLNLGVIMDAYKRKGEQFPPAHAAWIVNRLYNLAAYMEFYKKAFNGFSPSNIWVSPEYHTALLLGGWEYAEPLGGAMAGCPKDVYKVLPLKAKESHKSCTLTDQESIRQVGLELFKGSACRGVLGFLDGGSEDNGILSEWEGFEDAVFKDFNKRSFVVWDDVPYA